MEAREQMNIVIVGHVDHGKSTVIGRLLADTGSLPEGKLESVKEFCRKNARPFEYAFLLDALKDEQAQGITIDTARCFFKTNKRDYIIIDAPGHVEFLKNMVTGASRAEAALLVIDAKEGIKENSKRHGHIVSMLGIKQVVVLVNKMDLVGFDREVYEAIVSEFGEFLQKVNIRPINYIPISAFNGDNIAQRSRNTLWYDGPTVLEQLDGFVNKKENRQLPFRMPVQDIYKFTEEGDDRRIVAGTIISGSISVGDEVVFLPSNKKSVIKSIEGFNVKPRNTAYAELQFFWNRQMAEHAKFIRGLLDPTENDLINQANDFGNEFDQLTAEAKAAMDATSPMAKVTDESLKATEDFRNFKAQGTQAILECKVKSIIIPLLGDHVLREANHYLRLLKMFEGR